MIYHYHKRRKSMYNHFAHSKLAKKILTHYNIPTPEFLILSEWNDHESKYQNHPAVRIIKLIDDIEWIFYAPYRFYRAIRNYISNRHFDKIHYLNTELTPGQWYDLDTRLLYGMMNEYKKFVEYDLGMEYLWGEKRKDLRKEYGALLLKERVEDEELTLEYREVNSTLLRIYYWWVNEFPQRKTLEQLLYENGLEGVFYCLSENNETTKAVKKVYKEWDEYEKRYKEEETYYLCELIRLRTYLWT